MDEGQQAVDRQAERRFARTVLLLVVLGFAAVMFAGLAAVGAMLRSQEQNAWVRHTHEVEREVIGIRLSLEQMRSARRGFALKLANMGGATYPEASAALFAGIGRVNRLTVDNSRQQANVRALRAKAVTLDHLFRESMGMTGQRLALTEDQRQQVSREVETLARNLFDEERRLLQERDVAREDGVRTFYVVLGLTAVLLVLVAGGSVWVIRKYTADLNSSREALRELYDNLELVVADRTTDLRRANDEIQRFAYIVSHDLRSPLVNVMGFTAELDAAIKPLGEMIERVEVVSPDLVDEGSKLAVREDLPEAVGFIRTSTQKMDRLINAILRLSREGRRNIAPERLDLDALAHGVVDGLRHRIDELGVTITIHEGMPPVVSDRLAVEQILSNLVENAVKYLKPGRPGEIAISATTQLGRVLIDVADNGRGVEKRDHERIFDLFRRSGEQDQPGEGIGLAHVRALAYRLGGTISVESELGQGATFTINLPATFAGEKAALS